MSHARIITDDELLQLPEDGRRYEVVDGELVASPAAGLRHAMAVAELIAELHSFADERRLGLVLGPNLLYVLPSGNRRGSDLTFISAAKAAQLGPDTVFPELAPDLAVEVLSPFDSPRRMMERVGEYLEAGVRLVWVVDPEGRRAVIYRALSDVVQVLADGVLDGGDVLPGFRCRLADLLD
jgi:Uma2 family endonuclease